MRRMGENEEAECSWKCIMKFNISKREWAYYSRSSLIGVIELKIFYKFTGFM